jgi:hypothetical protein
MDDDDGVLHTSGGARFEVGVAAPTAAGSGADEWGRERTVASTDVVVDPTVQR